MPPERETPAAPVAPATAAPDQSRTPSPIQPPSAIEEASRLARDRVASTGTSVPAEPAEPVAPKPPHPSKDQLRADGGKFTDVKKREVGAGIPPEPPSPLDPPTRAAGEPEPDGGLAPVGDEPAPGEGEGAPAAGEAPAGEGEPAPGAEDAEGGEEDDLTVILPGRREGEEFPITVDDPETADRLRQMANGYMRGEQIKDARAELEETQSEIEAIRTEVAIDPGGFILSELGERPEIQEHVALFLLSQPNVWKAVAERVLAWDDPEKFRADANEIKAERYEVRETMRAEVATSRAVEANFQQINTTVNSLVPEDFPADKRETFYHDALRDIQTYAQRNNLMTVPPEALPIILRNRLAVYGLDPVEAAARAAESFGSGGSNRGPVSARKALPAPKSAATTGRQNAGAPRAPQRTGKEIAAAARKKQSAAAIPGSGAGAPNSTLTPPPGMSIEQTTEWHRKQMALRQRTSGGAPT